MSDSIDFFWELFNAVSGKESTGITTVLNSLAKSERAKVEAYFSNIIDQNSFNTNDYNKLRKLFIDLIATHRTMISQSVNSTEPHSLTNTNLDELFRSFGYPHSSQLRGFDENPLEQKVQFFLDLVNLYKVKGTPQSLLEVLQYYGVVELDIYEFLLKLSSPTDLIFNGKAIAGTSVNPNILQIPYNNLTDTDPHWLYTKEQILELNDVNKINLPSQSPYLGIQPIIDLDGVEFSIIIRNVQDQYNALISTGTIPPPNAEITFIGEIKSLLELYLSIIYMFNNIFSPGKEQDPCNFLCYDGTSTNYVEIINKFNELSELPIHRCDLNDLEPPLPTDSTSGLIIPSSYCNDSKLSQYYDSFTRDSTSNFLVNELSAGIILNNINPTLKTDLDNTGEPLDVLYSLLKDLANWVRTNIGYGFVNFGFILFGINEFFKTLKPVIEFFKPYRARLLLFESLQIRNRLFNTIAIEDDFNVGLDFTFHDFITGDGIPCCINDSTSLPICLNDNITKCQRQYSGAQQDPINWKDLWSSNINYSINDVVASGVISGTQYICIQDHVSDFESTKPGYGTIWTSMWRLYSEIVCTDSTGINVSVYSREVFDCGSYFDIGSVTDIPQELFIEVESSIHDHLRCPVDSSAFIVSEISNTEYISLRSQHVESGVSIENIEFILPEMDTNYFISATLRNSSGISSIYNYTVIHKETFGFTLSFSGLIDGPDYYIDWYITRTNHAGITNLSLNDKTKKIYLNQACPDSTNYTTSIILRNEIDLEPSIYSYNVIEKTSDYFTVKFSGLIDSSNYVLEWLVCEGAVEGIYDIPSGVSQIIVPLPSSVYHSDYPLLITMCSDSTSSSIYSLVVLEKNQTYFIVQFSDDIDNLGNYYISWIIPYNIRQYSTYDYYQTGGFRDFDEEGTFDCTHGFDMIDITVETVINFMLQENSDYLLLENEERILL